MQDEAGLDIPHGASGLNPAPSPHAMLAPRLARVAMAGPLLPAVPVEQRLLLSAPLPARFQSGAGRSAAPEPLLPVSVPLAPLDASLLDR